MTGAREHWLLAIRRKPARLRGCLLTMIVLGMYLPVLAVAINFGGPAAGRAVTWAAGTCFFGAMSAFLITSALQQPAQPLAGVAFAMLFRMGPPLSLTLFVVIKEGELLAAGLPYYMIGFYLVSLTAEVLLSLPPVDEPPSRNRSTGAASQAS